MATHTECGYGFFCGGDPRDFHPDYECCSEKEIENHKAACKLWDEAEARGETPTPEACPSGWVYDADGKPVMHVLRAPYGIGTYTYEVEDDDEDDSSNSNMNAFTLFYWAPQEGAVLLHRVKRDLSGNTG